MVTGGLGQYKIYVYGAVLALILALAGATYLYRAKADAATTRAEAVTKERDFYRFQMEETISSHNGYVAKLAAIQQQKQKVQVVYRDKIRRINDENLGTIDGPVVVFSMSDLDAYAAALTALAR
jgi:ABC-type Fe3+-citrate transport system substrate-binding protein